MDGDGTGIGSRAGCNQTDRMGDGRDGWSMYGPNFIDDRIMRRTKVKVMWTHAMELEGQKLKFLHASVFFFGRKGKILSLRGPES